MKGYSTSCLEQIKHLLKNMCVWGGVKHIAFKSILISVFVLTGIGAYAQCSLSSAGLNNISCYPNGTALNTSDDQIVFSLNPMGSGIGATYNVTVSSGSVVPTSGTYGSVKWFRLNAGSAGAGNVTITITDGSDPGCTVNATIIDPGSSIYGTTS